MKTQSIINWFNQLNLRAVFVIFCILGFAVYFNAISHPFVHDDIIFIQLNPHISDLNLKQIFNQSAFICSQSSLINQYYRPLLELLNRILFKVFGLNPQGFHFVNVCFHILNSYLLFRFLSLFCQKLNTWLSVNRAKVFAFVISIIFLLHPVQTEAVSCIAGISNLLSTLLTLLILIFYLKTIGNQNRKSRFCDYLFVLGFLLLGLFCKEQVIMVPVLILLIEILFKVYLREGLVRRLLIMVGIFGVCLGYFILRKILFGHSLTSLEGNNIELILRLLSIPRMILTHLSLVVWPQGLHYYRCIDILLPKLGPMIIFSSVSFITIVIVLKLKQHYRKLALFGLGWFVITILPTINIVPLINEYSFLLLAEHFLYFPIVGLLIFLLAVFLSWYDSFKLERIKHWLVIVFAGLLLVYSMLSINQNKYWSSEIALFERTLKYEPNFGRARILLAKAYANAGRVNEAIVEYNKALVIMQSYVAKVQDPNIALVYQRFIKEIFVGLAQCNEIKGDFVLVQAYYLKALEIDSADEVVYFYLGMNYIRTNQISEAVEVLEKGFKVNPKSSMIKNALAIVYKDTGRISEARKFFMEVAAEDPSSQSAQENLKNFLNEHGNE